MTAPRADLIAYWLRCCWKQTAAHIAVSWLIDWSSAATAGSKLGFCYFRRPGFAPTDSPSPTAWGLDAPGPGKRVKEAKEVLKTKSRVQICRGCCWVGRWMRVSFIEPTLETEPERLQDAARRRVFAAGIDSAGCIRLRLIREDKERSEIADNRKSSKKITCNSHQRCNSDYTVEHGDRRDSQQYCSDSDRGDDDQRQQRNDEQNRHRAEARCVDCRGRKFRCWCWSVISRWTRHQLLQLSLVEFILLTGIKHKWTPERRYSDDWSRAFAGDTKRQYRRLSGHRNTLATHNLAREN